MTARSRLRAAVYGDGDVPKWFDECVDAIEAEAREAAAERVAGLERWGRLYNPNSGFEDMAKRADGLWLSRDAALAAIRAGNPVINLHREGEPK